MVSQSLLTLSGIECGTDLPVPRIVRTLAMPFGYPLEPDFDLAKEQRRTRVGWTLLGGLILSILVSFSSGLQVATEVFQGCVATILCYGASFYVDRREYF